MDLKIKPRQTNGLGWIPSLPDHRDYKYSTTDSGLTTAQTKIAITNTAGKLNRVDLSPLFPENAYDQTTLGSCVSNASGGALQFDLAKQRKPAPRPSRLMIYYLGRLFENTIDSDSGMMARDSLKALSTVGVCPESEWAYDVSQYRTRPPDNCFSDALMQMAIRYESVQQTEDAMLQVLLDGYPIIIGFTVYDSFMTTTGSTGLAPLPKPDETVQGGHSVLVVGYDVSEDWFICRNSWGTNWGWNGYYVTPIEYLTNVDLAGDLWCLKEVS